MNPTQNTASAMAFYDLMFNQCRPAEAIERYAGAEYIQQNPHVADGNQAFIDYFERMAHRELVVFGLPVGTAHTLLNLAGEAIKEGRTFAADVPYDES